MKARNELRFFKRMRQLKDPFLKDHSTFLELLIVRCCSRTLRVRRVNTLNGAVVVIMGQRLSKKSIKEKYILNGLAFNKII